MLLQKKGKPELEEKKKSAGSIKKKVGMKVVFNTEGTSWAQQFENSPSTLIIR